MDTARITCLGELRTEALHLRSGQRIITDAPIDNHGRGKAFSPTDLLAAALATCMITTMDIKARPRGIALKGLTARVVKHMASVSRRVRRVEVHLELDGAGLSAEDRAFLEETARHCPVALSLHPGLAQEVTFTYR